MNASEDYKEVALTVFYHIGVMVAIDLAFLMSFILMEMLKLIRRDYNYLVNYNKCELFCKLFALFSTLAFILLVLR
jgi:hypothetical protein